MENWKETLATAFVILAFMGPLATCTAVVEIKRYEAQVEK